jgi:hypothetical protein
MPSPGASISSACVMSARPGDICLDLKSSLLSRPAWHVATCPLRACKRVPNESWLGKASSRGPAGLGKGPLGTPHTSRPRVSPRIRPNDTSPWRTPLDSMARSEPKIRDRPRRRLAHPGHRKEPCEHQCDRLTGPWRPTRRESCLGRGSARHPAPPSHSPRATVSMATRTSSNVSPSTARRACSTRWSGAAGSQIDPAACAAPMRRGATRRCRRETLDLCGRRRRDHAAQSWRTTRCARGRKVSQETAATTSTPLESQDPHAAPASLGAGDVACTTNALPPK